MSKALQNINRMPTRTWTWANVNDTSLHHEVPEIKAYKKNPVIGAVDTQVELTTIEEISEDTKLFFEKIEIEEETATLIKEHMNSGYAIHIKKNKNIEAPILLQYDMDEENQKLVDLTLVRLEEGASANVVIVYKNKGKTPVFHAGAVKFHVAEGAELKITKIQILSDKDCHIDYTKGIVQKEAAGRVLVAEIGAAQIISNADILLDGEKGQADLDSVYFGDGVRKLDFNHRIQLKAKQTVARMNARGVLGDTSEKIFKGTIDFISGASGADGQEEEFVVLLGPKVKNISIPLLLCGEDDVIGAHACSTGKLDENKMFYLMTRGMDEIAAKKVIVEATLTPILEKVDNEELKIEIFNHIRAKVDKEVK